MEWKSCAGFEKYHYSDKYRNWENFRVINFHNKIFHVNLILDALELSENFLPQEDRKGRKRSAF